MGARDKATTGAGWPDGKRVPDRRLEGQVALITGVATGIGRAGAKLFSNEGARVIGLDLDAPRGEATITEIRDAGGEAEFCPGDASSAADTQRAVQLAVARWQRLDILWSNAGIDIFKDVLSTTEADWDRVMAVNVKSAYLLAHYGIPQLQRSGGGAMLLTGSVNSVVAAGSRVAYAASKGAMLMLTRALALDHAADGIRVNCLCPGSVQTPLLDRALSLTGMGFEAAYEQDRAEHPLGRMGRPEEVATAALFLASSEASFITGTAMMVDGGFTAY